MSGESYRTVRPWVDAAVRQGADISAEEARVILAELDRLHAENAQLRRATRDGGRR